MARRRTLKDTGYLNIWGVDGIFVEDQDSILFIPHNEEDISKCRTHFEDTNFLMKYTGNISLNCTAFILRIAYEMTHAIRFFPQYIVKHCHSNTFTEFELSGEVIDDFFSPAIYFYNRTKAGEAKNNDYLYNREVADEWNLFFEGKSVKIVLLYGDILRWGIASDLKLHAKILVQFPSTKDTTYIYRLYRMVMSALQMMRHELSSGSVRIDLLTKDENHESYNGQMYDYCLNAPELFITTPDVNYENFRPYISRFMKFASGQDNYLFDHYSKKGFRFRGRDYSSIDFLNIFSAFEAECRAHKDIYENADASKIVSIKQNIIDLVNKYQDGELSDEEKDFLGEAKKRITQIGTQFGQKKKIENAYNVLKKAIDGSIEYIFFLPEYKLKGALQAEQIGKIASDLSSLRGKVAHGSHTGNFTDGEAQKIRFLEILTHAQLLRRVGLNDSEIEHVLGMVFYCNFEFRNRKR